METKTIGIGGMSCHHCVMAVTRALSAVPGVEVKDVKVGSATVAFDGSTAALVEIREAISSAGFEPER